jgi:hypothetical protein
MAVPIKATNVGGPAARQGFKYQDHVAAQFLLRMFTEREIIQIECETADDIVCVRDIAGTTRYEYIQVKTTELDKKWSLTEITKLDNKKKETSLAQKSLRCDSRGGLASFRIVSRRDIYKNLNCLKSSLSERSPPHESESLGKKLVKKYPSTASPCGRDLLHWAQHCVWQVEGEMRHLQAVNLASLSEVAERQGYILANRQLVDIYEGILEIADAAAVADAAFAKSDKTITNLKLAQWLEVRLLDAFKSNSASAKPYRSKPDPFLVSFHVYHEPDFTKGLSGYDVQFELHEWRSQAFAEHLIDWLPELALKPSELVTFQHHNLRQLMALAVAKIPSGPDEKSRLIAEIILHSILRNDLNSEPIACKAFQIEKDGAFAEYGNAHIVHYRDGRPDELWLGQAMLHATSKNTHLINDIAASLNSAISKAVLTKEKKIIISLREAQHLMPVSADLEKALSTNATLDDLVKILCFPVLIAYDSDRIKAGYVEDYQIELTKEITTIYQSILSEMKIGSIQARIIIFLVPTECVTTLCSNFYANCTGL